MTYTTTIWDKISRGQRNLSTICREQFANSRDRNGPGQYRLKIVIDKATRLPKMADNGSPVIILVWESEYNSGGG
ncbi:MAG: hypothetical protein ACTSU6_00525 [Candidatus Njordarchaeales archaeon]